MAKTGLFTIAAVGIIIELLAVESALWAQNSDLGLHPAQATQNQETQDLFMQDQGIQDQGIQDQGIQDQGIQDQGIQDQGRSGFEVRYDLELLNRPLLTVSPDLPVYDKQVPDDSSLTLLSDYRVAVYPYYLNETYCWSAANIRYQPLYFEDVTLERYGQTKGCTRQPWVSAVHFFSSAALLPINIIREHPYSCQFPLGYSLPGGRTPTLRERLIR